MRSLEVLHCDNHVLAVVKPAGLPVVPDDSGDSSLLDLAKAWVKREYDKPGEVFLGVVHRLDRPVSGIVVFGRTSKGASRLSAAWREGRVDKRYLALSPLRAPLPAEAGELRLWQRQEVDRNVVRVLGVAADGEAPPHHDAKLAVTRWRVLGTDADGTRLALEPVTGRKHQLRVACRHLGLPLAGDLKYGAEEPLPDKSVALHAWRLRVPHPTRDEELEFRAPPWWLPDGP